jgi:hypothetical protein
VSCFAEEQRMPRLLFAWVIWLSLTATSLNVVSAFVLDPSSPSRSQKATCIVPQLVSDDSPLGEDVTVPGKGERNFWGLEQQSKHVLAAVHSRDLVSLLSQRENRLRAAPASVLLPVRVWFPRKLSPPAAQDDPFLG